MTSTSPGEPGGPSHCPRERGVGVWSGVEGRSRYSSSGRIGHTGYRMGLAMVVMPGRMDWWKNGNTRSDMPMNNVGYANTAAFFRRKLQLLDSPDNAPRRCVMMNDAIFLDVLRHILKQTSTAQ